MDFVGNIAATLQSIHPWLLPATAVAALILTAIAANLLVKQQLIHLVRRLAAASKNRWDDALLDNKVFNYLAQVAPAVVVYFGIAAIPDLALGIVAVTRNITLAFLVLVLMRVLSALLTTLNDVYDTTPRSRERPIKGFIQIAKIIMFVVGIVVIIATLLDKSPLALLTGFGAMTAIVLLVFKDTILSFVASVQLSSTDMVRVGDWIEMPEFNADGDVIEVALHTVRVQNFDKTITTIPTHRLISTSFRNWRGMSDSGGRRIKRALQVDVSSVRFMTPDEIQHFRRFALLTQYIETKEQELSAYNEALGAPVDEAVNTRRLTNLGTFRAYVINYLQNHPQIHPDMTLLVRQLAPSPTGIPLEIYCFTRTTDWHEYEAIQADIFDHMLAICGEFGLLIYQQPSGADIAALVPD
jgi:miniconductance mechanosensitive channel